MSAVLTTFSWLVSFFTIWYKAFVVAKSVTTPDGQSLRWLRLQADEADAMRARSSALYCDIDFV